MKYGSCRVQSGILLVGQTANLGKPEGNVPVWETMGDPFAWRFYVTGNQPKRKPTKDLRSADLETILTAPSA